MGWEGLSSPKQKFSSPKRNDAHEPISPIGLGPMCFAFSILYLTSGKSPLQAEFSFGFEKFGFKLQPKLAPQTKNPGYVPGGATMLIS